jgi:uridine kinase
VRILIHASAVKLEKGAAIFLGPSGAGKSTVTKLVRNGKPLADDMVYLVEKDGVWGVIDATHRFKPGQIDFEKEEAVPLVLICTLVKKIEYYLRVNLDLRQAIVSAFNDVWWNKDNMLYEEKLVVFRALMGLCKTVRSHKLIFEKDKEFEVLV